jgi:hypothetical protein
MAKSGIQRIEELEAAKLKIAARLQAEKARLRAEDRKRDSRRKIIVGAVALEHAKLHPEFAAELMAILAKHVARPADRLLLELPPLTKE